MMHGQKNIKLCTGVLIPKLLTLISTRLLLNTLQNLLQEEIRNCDFKCDACLGFRTKILVSGSGTVYIGIGVPAFWRDLLHLSSR
jgi:hypothetical protein